MRVLGHTDISEIPQTGSDTVSSVKEGLGGGESAERMFLDGLYRNINFDETKDFVVNFDDFWDWFGLTRKDRSKNQLKFYGLRNGKDYRVGKLSDKEVGELHEKRGANNKRKIFLNSRGFRKIRMLMSGPDKESVADYYLDLEEVLFKLVLRDCPEMREKLRASGGVLRSSGESSPTNHSKVGGLGNLLDELCSIRNEIEKNKKEEERIMKSLRRAVDNIKEVY